MSKAQERVNLPVYGFNGGKDSAAINDQWNDAAELAQKNGYKNLAHTLVPTGGHGPYPAEVLNFFATLLEN